MAFDARKANGDAVVLYGWLCTIIEPNNMCPRHDVDSDTPCEINMSRVDDLGVYD